MRSNRWDERYASGEAPEKPPEPLLVQAVSFRMPGKALDLACGPGRNALYLAAQGWAVTAVDSSRVALDILAERAAEGLTVTPVWADLESGAYTIPLEEFDLIVDTNFLFRPLFPLIRAGIRPGGLFVGVFPLSGINPEFLMRSGEAKELFGDWKLLHYAEEENRAEIVAEKWQYEQRPEAPAAVHPPDKS